QSVFKALGLGYQLLESVANIIAIVVLAQKLSPTNVTCDIIRSLFEKRLQFRIADLARNAGECWQHQVIASICAAQRSSAFRISSRYRALLYMPATPALCPLT